MSEEMGEGMEEQRDHKSKKKTKRMIDEKKEAENFKKLMGSGL